MSDLITTDTAGPRIQQGSQVTLHFSLMLANGEEVDTTRNGSPATFTVGDGNLLPGFEAVLLGQQQGYAAQIELAPDSAFGEHNPGNVQVLGKERFAGLEEELETGLMVSFQAPDGELPGVVLDVYEQTVKVDFNHPLAGRTIIFDVAVLEVKAPDTDISS